MHSVCQGVAVRFVFHSSVPAARNPQQLYIQYVLAAGQQLLAPWWECWLGQASHSGRQSSLHVPATHASRLHCCRHPPRPTPAPPRLRQKALHLHSPLSAQRHTPRPHLSPRSCTHVLCFIVCVHGGSGTPARHTDLPQGAVQYLFCLI